MVMKSNNEVETNREDEEKKIPLLEDVDNVYVKCPVKGEALVVRRTLNMHIKVDDSEGQRENIFHTRCHVYYKVCSLIIDSGSCINVASTELMRKLNLHITKHSIPYKL